MAKDHKNFPDRKNWHVILFVLRLALMFNILLISLLCLPFGPFTSPGTKIGPARGHALVCHAQIPLGSRELSYGSRGDDVLELQYRLNLLGFYIKVLDGVYGNETRRVVLEFQAAADLARTGKVDAATAQAILSGNVRRAARPQAPSVNHSARKPSAPNQPPKASVSKTPASKISTSKASMPEVQAPKSQTAASNPPNSALAAKRQDIVHVVKEGECLSILGEKYNVTVKEIMKLNGLRNTIIYIGQKLTIPVSAGAAKEKSVPRNIEYVVKEGDCLYTIAASFKTAVSSIVRANNIKDPDFIRIGQTLTIPLS